MLRWNCDKKCQQPLSCDFANLRDPVVHTLNDQFEAGAAAEINRSCNRCLSYIARIVGYA